MAEPTPPTDPTEPTEPIEPTEPSGTTEPTGTPAAAPGEYAAPDAASLQAGYLPPAPGVGVPAPQPVKKVSVRRRVLTIVIGAAVFAAASIGTLTLLRTINAANSPQAIARTVDQLKSQYSLPQQVDEVTTLDDITAEGSNIHYHYTIAGADTTGLTEQALSDSILPQLCAQKETRSVLDKDIGMNYSYVVAETGDEFHLEFTKADC